MTKNVFVGYASLDNLKSTSLICIKFGKSIHYINVWNPKLLEMLQYIMTDQIITKITKTCKR